VKEFLVPVLAGDRTLLVGVRDYQARIDRKAFTAYQARRTVALHNAVKHAPEDDAAFGAASVRI
jgi:hypothetical protein